LIIAGERLANLDRLAVQAADRDGAAEQIRLAQGEAQRIRKIGVDVEGAVQKTVELRAEEEEARTALTVAQELQVQADIAFKTAEEAARAEGSDPGMTDTVVRQQLELRKAAAAKTA